VVNYSTVTLQQFTAEYASERILKISDHLAWIQTRRKLSHAPRVPWHKDELARDITYYGCTSFILTGSLIITSISTNIKLL